MERQEGKKIEKKKTNGTWRKREVESERVRTNVSVASRQWLPIHPIQTRANCVHPIFPFSPILLYYLLLPLCDPDQLHRSFFGCFFATTISLGPSRTEPFFLQRSRFFAKQSKKRTSESRERKKEKNPSLQSNYSLAQYEEYQASMIASKERLKYYKW